VRREGATLGKYGLCVFFSLSSSSIAAPIVEEVNEEEVDGGDEDLATQKDAAVRSLGEDGISGEHPDVGDDPSEYGELPLDETEGEADAGEAATAIEGSHHDAVFE
jgi:hypothetical protein